MKVLNLKKYAKKLLFGILNYTMSDWERDLRTVIGSNKALSGVSVNEQTAMKFTAVFACVRILSETLASLPLYLYKRRPDGGKDRATDHPLYDVLHSVPNDEMPSMTWRETQQSHICLSGNGYAIPELNWRGQVISLYPWPWTQIEPRRNRGTGKVEYHLKDRGKTEVLPFDRVFHIPGLGFDGVKGYSPIRMAQEAVGLGLAAETFGALFYGNGTNIGGILEAPQVLSDAAFNRLKESFKEKYAGMFKSHEVPLLEEGTKFNKVSIPPNEAQFIESRQFQVVEIARIYRVPLHLLQDLTKSSFSNIEQQSLEFIKYTMLPWLYRWEQYINFKLLTQKDRQEGYKAEFLVTALLRGDAKSQAEALHIARQDGVINADEWREFLDMNPQEGDYGKIYLINGNMISVETASKQLPRRTQEGNGGDGKSA